MITKSADELSKIGYEIFLRVGAPHATAKRVSSALVDANLTGHDSHGVFRIMEYLDRIEDKEVIPEALPSVLDESGGMALVDGNWGFGQVSAEYATELAIEKARQHKIAGVGVVRCSHIGRLGEYSTLAARAGIIALVTAGGFGVPPGAAPFGGSKAALSTNPISMGFPATKIPMVLMDFATTQVAAGKIRVAAEKGEQLPPGCILDTEGRPSTDPQDFFDGGTMQHFGAHKGYGLSVAVDLLGGALTGAPLYAETQMGKSIYGTSGTFIIAIDPEAFRPLDQFHSLSDALIGRIKDIPPAPGVREVLIPGEPELRMFEQRSTEGIPLPERTWEQIVDAATSLGVEV